MAETHSLPWRASAGPDPWKSHAYVGYSMICKNPGETKQRRRNAGGCYVPSVGWPMQVQLWKGLLALRRKQFLAEVRKLHFLKKDITFHRTSLRHLTREVRLLRAQTERMREMRETEAMMREEIRTLQMMLPRVPRYCYNI